MVFRSSSSSSGGEEESRKASPPGFAAAAADHGDDRIQQKLNVPIGYRFNPTDIELVLNYLFNKLVDLPLPADIIPYLDFDITDLEQFPTGKFPYWKENEAYFFGCKDQGERSDFWKAAAVDEEIVYDGKVVGLKSTFVFYRVREGIEEETDWIMTEFRVHPSLIPDIQNKKLRVYKIQYDPERKSLMRTD